MSSIENPGSGAATPPQFALNAEQRAHDLERARTERFDVVVIGGGITGSGAALDAASRGLSVLLLEASDFATGTSSKSSKLIHGGLRYLEMLDFALVKEALGERKRLLQDIAPHLVKPVPFVWPLTHAVWERAYMGVGLVLYDTLAGRSAVPRHRHLSRTGFQAVAPGLDPGKHYGGIQFYDAIEDDARMTMTVARTARGRGAAVVARARVDELVREGERVVGVRATDLIGGEPFEVSAAHVVSAAGPWTNQVLEMIGVATEGFKVLPSKGVHIMVPRERLEAEVGILMRTEKSVLFVIPWGRFWLIGDTDTEWREKVSAPVASGSDLDYLLEKVNSLLADPLTRDDIVGSFAGLRPLVQGDPGQGTTKISREHQVMTPVPGLSLIAGGKYTTYRVMAADLVDAAVDPQRTPSQTECLPLVGAEGYQASVPKIRERAARLGLSEAVAAHLEGRYGSAALDVLGLVERDPALADRLSPELDYIGAEVLYACVAEGALSLDDVMTRRTRIRIQLRDAGLSLTVAVAAIMADALCWDAARATAEIADYRRSVEAEAAALSEHSDAEAYGAYSSTISNAADLPAAENG